MSAVNHGGRFLGGKVDADLKACFDNCLISHGVTDPNVPFARTSQFRMLLNEQIWQFLCKHYIIQKED